MSDDKLKIILNQILINQMAIIKMLAKNADKDELKIIRRCNANTNNIVKDLIGENI